MQLLDGELVLSASDLTGFSACAHLTQLELRAARGEIERAKRDDPMLDVLSRRGLEHEDTLLKAFHADAEKTVIEIDFPDSNRAALEDAQEQTLEAMRKGVDVIYQATFFDGRWRGHADFLLRVETPSDLGDWSYEVADAKLARRVKAAAILQMCAYSEQLARLQGVAPRHIHVITGDGERHTVKLSDYSAYYRALKARYEALVLCEPDTSTYPEKVDHCASAAGSTCAPSSGAPTTTSHSSPACAATRPASSSRRRVHHHRARRAHSGPARRRHRRRVARAPPPPGRAPGARAAGSSRRSSRCSRPSARQPTANPTRRGSSAGSPRCRRRRPATSSSTWRATPTRSKAGSSTCSAWSSSTRTASRTTARSGRTTATRRARRSRSSSTS